MSTQFSDLPSELRFKIYELALEPRNIHLELNQIIHIRTSMARTEPSKTPVLAVRGVQTSTLLHLCRETRQEYYRPLFQGRLTAPSWNLVGTGANMKIVEDGKGKFPRGLWINPNIDVIVLSHSYEWGMDYPGTLFALGNLAAPEDLACIKYMNLDYNMWEKSKWRPEEHHQVLERLQGLRNLCLRFNHTLYSLSVRGFTHAMREHERNALERILPKAIVCFKDERAGGRSVFGREANPQDLCLCNGVICREN